MQNRVEYSAFVNLLEQHCVMANLDVDASLLRADNSEVLSKVLHFHILPNLIDVTARRRNVLIKLLQALLQPVRYLAERPGQELVYCPAPIRIIAIGP